MTGSRVRYWADRLVFPREADELGNVCDGPDDCRRAVRVLTNSDTLGEELVRYVGVPRGKMRTVYASADETFRPITNGTVICRPAVRTVPT